MTIRFVEFINEEKITSGYYSFDLVIRSLDGRTTSLHRLAFFKTLLIFTLADSFLALTSVTVL
tara:strand:- start:3668 stop:3856 length:189 start_codon:yes stop_codon:yes gene_type:complete